MDADEIRTAVMAVSALAASASTFFAAHTLRASNEARRLEFESGRPHFSFAQFGLERVRVSKALSEEKEILDPTSAHISGYLKNCGLRPASNVSGSIFILPGHPGRDISLFPIGVGDDVAPGTELNVSSGRITIVAKEFPGREAAPAYIDPGFFVAVGISYEDRIAKNEFVQLSVMRWPGVANNVISGVLVSATKEERDRMLSSHKKLLKQFDSRQSEAA